MPAWEGSESLFYASVGSDSPQVLLRDMHTGKRQVLATTDILGDQYAVSGRYVYVGTSQGIKTIEWHIPGTASVIGPGMNPNSW